MSARVEAAFVHCNSVRWRGAIKSETGIIDMPPTIKRYAGVSASVVLASNELPALSHAGKYLIADRCLMLRLKNICLWAATFANLSAIESATWVQS